MGRVKPVHYWMHAAVFTLPAGKDLVVSSDTLNSGDAFFRKLKNLLNIAHKALRVNLSDMAAMGAQPRFHIR